jgi:UbiD family decarboxylase
MSSLQAFLDALDPADVVRIPAPFDYVPTAIVMEAEKSGRSPVVYVEAEGSRPPVVVNLFGDRSRIARIAGLTSAEFFPRWGGFLNKLVPPRLVSDGAAQEHVAEGKDVDCGSLPICRHFAEEAGRYVTAGVFVCKDPDTGVRNLSFARMLPKGPRQFSINLGSRGDLSEHHGRAEARKRHLEAAVVIGAPPAFYLAASAKVAMDVDEYDLAGSFLGRPLDVVKCRTIDVEVPADAEIVLEGEILAEERDDEGPAAEYTGYASGKSTRNVFVVKAMTRKAKPLYLDIVPGKSSEHLLLGGIARQARDYSRIKEMVPKLQAINFPFSGNLFHAYLSLKKPVAGEARRALMVLFGADPYVKLAIAVDDDIDVFDEAAVLGALATRFQADADMFVVPKVVCNLLDPSSSGGMGAKLGIDATVPAGWSEHPATIPQDAVMKAKSIIDASQWR